jgi:hypothetical protein
MLQAAIALELVRTQTTAKKYQPKKLATVTFKTK